MQIGLLIGLLIGFSRKSFPTSFSRIFIPIVSTVLCAAISISPAFKAVLHGFLPDDDDYDDYDAE